MQRLIAAILLLAFIGQTFSQCLYYIDYLVDKAEYVKLCKNKSRPQMHCNGKCELMKKIEEQEKREQQNAPEMKLAGKIELLASKNSYETIGSPCFAAVHYHIISKEGSPIDQPSSIYHPPGA